MKAVVDAKAFSEALNQVSKVPKRSTIPVLEGLLVRFENGRCLVTGTDLTTWLTMEVPAQGDDFSFVFQKPQAAAKACRYFEGELSLEMTDEESKYPMVTLRCGQRAGIFDGFPEKEYPKQPKLEEGEIFITNAANLLKRIERVKYAVLEPRGYSEQTQKTCVQFSGNSVFGVDGYRAACDTDPDLTFPKPFLTWGDSLSYLKLMGNSDVCVKVEERHIWLSSDSVSICCRKEGVMTFDLRSAVPKCFLEGFYVSPKEFLRELKYLDGFQPKSKSPVRFCGGNMTLQSDTIRCATRVEIEGDNEIAFGFSPRFMEDALKQFSEEKWVKIKISGVNTPIILEAEGRNDFAMVLPVRLRETRAA